MGGLPAIRYVSAPRTQGPAGARNAGWREAAGPGIAFTDDDTIADPLWLRNGCSALLAQPNASAAADRLRARRGRARPRGVRGREPGPDWRFVRMLLRLVSGLRCSFDYPLAANPQS